MGLDVRPALLTVSLLLAAGPALAQVAPPAPAAAPPTAQAAAPRARPVELYLGLGYGNAVCDNKRPDSDCPVDGAFALGLGGGWRFASRFAVGLELAHWSFKVRESWRGHLPDDATHVDFSASHVSPFVRWYWFGASTVEPYLHFALGAGSVQGEAKNASASYSVKATGLATSLGLGVDWHVTPALRLGPQAYAYLLAGNEICERSNGGDQTCRKPQKNANGDQEGVALPWRLMLMATVMLGGA